MSDERRLRNLAAAQVALGVIAGVLAPLELPPLGLQHILPPLGLQHILIVPLAASAPSQAVLLAVWAVASPGALWKRLTGLIVGAAYGEVLLVADLGAEFLGTAAVTVAAATALWIGVRALGVRSRRRAEEARPGRPASGGLRFSIWGLMTLTAAVALLGAGARALQATRLREVLFTLAWVLCFVAVALAALWAALGEAEPRRRVPVVFALSTVLGVIFACAADTHPSGRTLILLTMTLYPAILLGSLLVMRSCGYRLVGRAVPSPG